MAWTEQCKVAFQMNASGKLAKYKNKNRKVRGVLRQLSIESDIPLKTLEGWYYEKESIDLINEVDSDDKDLPIEIPICSRCEINLVYTRRNGKTLTEESKYFGLCNGCRTNQQYIEVIDRDATKNKIGIMTVCPHCEKAHYTNLETQYTRKKGVE